MPQIRTLLTIIAFFAGLAACNQPAPPDQAAETETPALTEAEQTQYLAQGKSIALASFEALSGQLKAALQEGGVQHAVQYCNLAAYPIIDSLSQVHEAQIRRTTDKVRNPKNAPTATEQAMLQDYAQKAASGADLSPTVKLIDPETVAFYAPIKTQALCLTCHGVPGETILEADYALIRELYPQDQAIGYQNDAFRGIWSIQFKRTPQTEIH